MIGSQYDAGPCIVLRHAALPALVDAGLEFESLLVFHCIVTFYSSKLERTSSHRRLTSSAA